MNMYHINGKYSSIFTLQYQLGQYEYAAFQWKVRVLYSYDATLEDHETHKEVCQSFPP